MAKIASQRTDYSIQDRIVLSIEGSESVTSNSLDLNTFSKREFARVYTGHIR